MSNLSYQALVKILDSIRRDAPQTEEFSRYYSPNPKDIEFSRGQAYIHLFLLAKFGLSNFRSRHEYICEGSGDGGLDAYYIDEDNHLIFLIQSKFKNTSSGFRSGGTSAVELNKMSVEQILNGKDNDVTGTPFNEKVRRFQSQLYEVKKKNPYECKVVFLANVTSMTDAQLRRFTSGIDYEIFNFDRSYIELVKRVCSATYYDAQDIKISVPIDLRHTDGKELCKTINTSHGRVELSAYFVPTLEIGKLMSQYKNAILEYNPRNYLGLSEKKNSVNPQIRDTILMSPSVNDFALLNNGITIFATWKKFSKETGAEDKAFLYINNPQIINGGQTAYTLSELYLANQDNMILFEDKEVLVRVIVPIQNENQEISKENSLRLIESVSYSTNSQTPIKEPDKRSNSFALHQMQNELFRKYGRLLEIKRGEFYDGINKEYVTEEMIIDRVDMLRAFLAFSKSLPNLARSAGEAKIFEKNFFAENYEKIVILEPEKMASEVFFATQARKELNRIEKESKQLSDKIINSLRYGKYAVLAAISISMNQGLRDNLPNIQDDEIINQVKVEVDRILTKWSRFEKHIQDIKKYPENKNYFDLENNVFDFDNYTKGKTINTDIKSFDWKKH